MDSNSISFLAFAALFAGLLFAKIPPVERRLVAAAGRWGERIGEGLRREPEQDPLVLQMLEAQRRERLHEDLRRLQRLVATDQGMSGTRQLGNRLAYAWVIREQSRLADVPMWFDDEDAMERWTSPVAQTRRAPARSVAKAGVETIDIGW